MNEDTANKLKSIIDNELNAAIELLNFNGHSKEIIADRIRNIKGRLKAIIDEYSRYNKSLVEILGSFHACFLSLCGLSHLHDISAHLDESICSMPVLYRVI